MVMIMLKMTIMMMKMIKKALKWRWLWCWDKLWSILQDLSSLMEPNKNDGNMIIIISILTMMILMNLWNIDNNILKALWMFLCCLFQTICFKRCDIWNLKSLFLAPVQYNPSKHYECWFFITKKLKTNKNISRSNLFQANVIAWTPSWPHPTGVNDRWAFLKETHYLIK